jgi:heptosyltransferase-1
MQNCLVIKTSSLGDIFQTLKVIACLKKSHKELSITWVVEKRWAKTLEAFSIVDELIIVDFKSWRKKPFFYFKEIISFIKQLKSKTYDLVLDFQANTKSGAILGLSKGKQKRSFTKSQVAEYLHRFIKAHRITSSLAHTYLFYFGLIEDLCVFDPDVEIALHPDYLIKPNNLPDSKKIVMLGLGSNWASKRLNVDQVQTLIKDLDQKQQPFFVIPALRHEIKDYESLLIGYQGQVVSFSDLKDYIPYLLASDLFYGVDSSLLHLARLFKIETKAFFGPSSLQFYGQSQDIQGSCPYQETFSKRCEHLRKCKAPCMKSIEIKLV